MKDITKGLGAVGATCLPEWGPDGLHWAWLETFRKSRAQEERNSHHYSSANTPILTMIDPWGKGPQEYNRYNSCSTLSVPNCHPTRRKHEGQDTARLPRPRQGKSRGRGQGSDHGPSGQ
ncbi:hypothetical protein T265_11174 [Opisthorchis viverrini]|uniref:Uncharacterized protein n=1 Tax=Opisthorchis viverrini TaxID=6198 RepID=A0A074YZM7_OPIVI|nr:hypothetical protein T265_11174 [Opisthorchis viverrini]KER20221.1 hypothetical protein T265_11174 [Opisthorchis viverrini]